MVVVSSIDPPSKYIRLQYDGLTTEAFWDLAWYTKTLQVHTVCQFKNVFDFKWLLKYRVFDSILWGISMVAKSRFCLMYPCLIRPKNITSEKKNIMEQFISTEAASNFRVTASGNEKIKKTVMIVDDDLEIQQLLKSFYADLDFNLQIFSDPLQALTHLQPKPVKRIVVCETVDLIICDLKMPRMDGLEFMDRLREANLQIPVIMITGHASKETAIEALHKGAFDYITKPINFLELGVLSRRAIKLRSLEEDYHALKKVLVRSWRMDEILGKSPKMQQLFDLIGRVAAFPSNVLITGESGTGKEMVARTIHAQSSRAEKPFIAVNCSAIPENLLESELFGHVRGSFTGATFAGNQNIGREGGHSTD
jgi:CheY-like chemotaxis protein